MKKFQIKTATSSQKSMYQLKNHPTPEKPTSVCCRRIKDQKEPRDEAPRDGVVCPGSRCHRSTSQGWSPLPPHRLGRG